VVYDSETNLHTSDGTQPYTVHYCRQPQQRNKSKMTKTQEPHSEISEPKPTITTEIVPSSDSSQEVGITNSYEDVELGDPTLVGNQDVAKTSSLSPPAQPVVSLLSRVMQCAYDYDFLIGLIVVILLAKAYPPLGAKILKPKITATWVAVIYIFRTYHIWSLESLFI
jgi:hypothetical protein